MTLRVARIDSTRFRNAFTAKAIRAIDEVGLPTAGRIVTEIIQDDTSKGINPSRIGTPMPYSDPYAARKGALVNWRLSGEMINSVHYEAIEQGRGMVKPSDDYMDRAFWVSGGNPRIPARPFMQKSLYMVSKVVQGTMTAIIHFMKN